MKNSRNLSTRFRKDGMKMNIRKRVLSIITALAMLFALLPPGAARAVPAVSFNISNGDIEITQKTGGYDINQRGVTNSYTYSDEVEITGSSTGNKITVEVGTTVSLSAADFLQITINNLNISNTESPFQLLGTAKVALTLSGMNTLTCTSTNPYGDICGIYAGLYAAPDAEITIVAEAGAAGKLTAKGGEFGAGIGGSFITALPYPSPENAAGTITIKGGEVAATGGDYSAGIGGGAGGDGGDINITGGTVIASGGQCGAGIGSGDYVDGGYITISGGKVTANGGDSGAGIGGGYGGNGGDISISGGTIVATKGSNAPYDIGKGAYASSGGTIEINGGSVCAAQ